MNDPVELLAQLIKGASTSALEDVHVSMPGRIESYDILKQRAVVQPLIKRIVQGEDGEPVAELYPAVDNVPIEFFGGGDYALTFPVVKGMTCRLQVCSADLDLWLTRGGEVEPKSDRRFHITDSVAVVGLRDFAHALLALPSNAWVMAAPAGSQIRLGSTFAVESTYKANSHHTLFATLIAAIATAVGASGTPATAPAAGTAVTSALATYVTGLAAVLTQKVRVE